MEAARLLYVARGTEVLEMLDGGDEVLKRVLYDRGANIQLRILSCWLLDSAEGEGLDCVVDGDAAAEMVSPVRSVEAMERWVADMSRDSTPVDCFGFRVLLGVCECRAMRTMMRAGVVGGARELTTTEMLAFGQRRSDARYQGDYADDSVLRVLMSPMALVLRSACGSQRDPRVGALGHDAEQAVLHYTPLVDKCRTTLYNFWPVVNVEYPLPDLPCLGCRVLVRVNEGQGGRWCKDVVMARWNADEWVVWFLEDGVVGIFDWSGEDDDMTIDPEPDRTLLPIFEPRPPVPVAPGAVSSPTYF